MATLQAIHGRLIDLRRYTNVHLTHGRRPLGPTERYELHEISLIVTTQKVPQVLGLANWSILDGVNYARSEAPALIRVWDFPLLAVAFLIMAAIWGDVGMVLFVPGALAYLLMVSVGRSVVRKRSINRVI